IDTTTVSRRSRNPAVHGRPYFGATVSVRTLSLRLQLTVELTRRRLHSSIAGPMMIRNTRPPLASNELFGGAPPSPRAPPAPRTHSEQDGTDEEPPIPDSEHCETKPAGREQVARLNQNGCQPE